MTGTMIDGKAVAAQVRGRVKEAVAHLKSEGTTPCLATILVGDDPASATYVRTKHKACEEAGIQTRDHKLPGDTRQEALGELIDSLNSDATVHGILLQLPLPDHLDEFAAISTISPLKDVDGLTPHNAGLLVSQKAALVACTPSGIVELLDHYGIAIEGTDIVIINRSSLVGRPLYHLLVSRGATVTTCHSKTRDLASHCRRADIIVTAVGNRDRFELTPEMIRDGATVIDVAISRYQGRLAGDSEYEQIIKKAAYATPVPGGVGPMTVAMLLKNTVTAASLGASLGR